jgi:hypothetical protein
MAQMLLVQPSVPFLGDVAGAITHQELAQSRRGAGRAAIAERSAPALMRRRSFSRRSRRAKAEDIGRNILNFGMGEKQVRHAMARVRTAQPGIEEACPHIRSPRDGGERGRLPLPPGSGALALDDMTNRASGFGDLLPGRPVLGCSGRAGQHGKYDCIDRLLLHLRSEPQAHADCSRKSRNDAIGPHPPNRI